MNPAHRWRRFAIIAGICALVTALVLALCWFLLGNRWPTTLVIGETLTTDTWDFTATELTVASKLTGTNTTVDPETGESTAQPMSAVAGQGATFVILRGVLTVKKTSDLRAEVSFRDGPMVWTPDNNALIEAEGHPTGCDPVNIMVPDRQGLDGCISLPLGQELSLAWSTTVPELHSQSLTARVTLTDFSSNSLWRHTTTLNIPLSGQ
jgi:hypothetical protein